MSSRRPLNDQRISIYFGVPVSIRLHFCKELDVVTFCEHLTRIATGESLRSAEKPGMNRVKPSAKPSAAALVIMQPTGIQHGEFSRLWCTYVR